VNISTDHGGTPRHVPLLMRMGDDLLPSFALRTAMQATRDDPRILPNGIQLGRTRTITDLGANLPLRFYGPRGTIRTVSAYHVLGGRVLDPELRDRVVVIGVTAAGTGDTFNTPFDPGLPGLEVLATAICHLLAGDGLVRGTAVRRIDAAITLFVPPLVILLLAVRRIGLGLLLVALTGTIWTAAVLTAFQRGIWLSMSVPLAAAIPSGALYMSARLWLDRRIERHLNAVQAALRGFQPPALGEHLAARPAYLESPAKQDTAVLFVDLSGFTGASEQLGPEETRALLKAFHILIEREAHGRGGLVLSFMGDGAMTVFGVPETKPDDARRALQAAVALVRTVKNWLDTLPAQVRKRLDVRVGAHFGPVILSRLGGEQQQQITVAGDSVNVASRLLEVAAEQRKSLAISDELYRAASPAQDEAECLGLGSPQTVRIRGRTEPLVVRFG
jgi:adenylate cyclase